MENLQRLAESGDGVSGLQRVIYVALLTAARDLDTIEKASIETMSSQNPREDRNLIQLSARFRLVTESFDPIDEVLLYHRLRPMLLECYRQYYSLHTLERLASRTKPIMDYLTQASMSGDFGPALTPLKYAVCL
jgi:hypothetical protein